MAQAPEDPALKGYKHQRYRMPMGLGEQELTPDEYKATTDKDYQARNPALAAYNRKYPNVLGNDRTIGGYLGSLFKGGLNSWNSHNFADNPMINSPLKGALGGSLLGLLGGAVGGAMGMPVSASSGAMYGALGGAGLGAYSGYQQSQPRQYFPNGVHDGREITYGPDRRPWDKRASFNDTSEVIGKVSQAPIDFATKSKLLSAIPNLSGSDIATLASILGSVTGAAIGAVVFQFLVGKGLLGAIAGGIAGGYLSRPSANMGWSGNEIPQGKDLFGNPFN